jgi:membrane associated rhomboid family serine protease
MSDESVRAPPQDGAIDFSRYSTGQLRELQFGIDRHSFPQNFANLSAELARREAGPAEHPTFEAKFSRRGGIPGWLEAASRRSPFYGAGSVQLTPTHLVVRAWVRTWLGAPEQVEVDVPLADIHNVVRDGAQIHFEYKRRFSWHRQVELTTESPEHARELMEGLPREQSAGFEQRWAELRDYNRRVKAANVRVWVTPAVLAVNVLVFAAMAVAGGTLGEFQPQLYIDWGANYGELTVTGQWWRLVTALFVHFNLMHLVLNMWAFWNIGRLTERLYGNGLMLLLYFGSGVLASLTTVLWDPTHYSVGASGAIFGIFGAFLAFLSHRETHVPVTVIRAHWLSTGLFVVFNLVNAALAPEIDNAAHIGGLLGGFALGWILARPLESAQEREFPFRQLLAACGLLGVALVSFRWHEGNTALSAPEKYLAAHPKLVKDEVKNIELWQGLLNRLAAGRVTPAELADRFEHDVLPFWVETDRQLKREALSTPGDQRPVAALMAEVARLRIEWLSSIAAALRNTRPNPDADPAQLALDTDFATARIELLLTRAALDRRPPGLTNSKWVNAVRNLTTGDRKWQCIEDPEWSTQQHGQDSKTDGPAMREAAACLAQRLFAFGDYVELDARLQGALHNLHDLPDGASTLQGMVGGLYDLFVYSTTDFPRLLACTSNWRRAVPGSIQADLAEAQVYEAWAWRARGFGAGDSVSPENWMLFNHRNALAAAELEDLKTRAVKDPSWYVRSIEVGVNRRRGSNELRATFDAGVKQVPGYLPLYQAMVRSLMPRWSGSVQEIDRFIEDVTDQPGSSERNVQLYARLYWSYDTLEHGDIKLFDDSLAVWPLMKAGFASLVKQYPRSDALLNAYAKFACIGEDAAKYWELRPAIEQRRSAAVWGHSATVESCDGHFNAAHRPGPVVGP